MRYCFVDLNILRALNDFRLSEWRSACAWDKLDNQNESAATAPHNLPPRTADRTWPRRARALPPRHPATARHNLNASHKCDGSDNAEIQDMFRNCGCSGSSVTAVACLYPPTSCFMPSITLLSSLLPLWLPLLQFDCLRS